MNIMEKWRICRLEEREKIESFRCGDPDLDDFLLNDSSSYSKSLLANTYLLEIGGMVAAYFSLANDSISINDFTSVAGFNKFRKKRFVNSKRIRSYPAVKICRFAINERIRNMGIGSKLLDVIKVLFLVENKAACRFITVDAYKNALPFYERNGFIPLQHQDSTSTTSLLFFDLMTAK